MSIPALHPADALNLSVRLLAITKTRYFLLWLVPQPEASRVAKRFDGSSFVMNFSCLEFDRW